MADVSNMIGSAWDNTAGAGFDALEDSYNESPLGQLTRYLVTPESDLKMTTQGKARTFEAQMAKEICAKGTTYEQWKGFIQTMTKFWQAGELVSSGVPDWWSGDTSQQRYATLKQLGGCGPRKATANGNGQLGGVGGGLLSTSALVVGALVVGGATGLYFLLRD